jgi:hypothetical protein
MRFLRAKTHRVNIFHEIVTNELEVFGTMLTDFKFTGQIL